MDLKHMITLLACLGPLGCQPAAPVRSTPAAEKADCVGELGCGCVGEVGCGGENGHPFVLAEDLVRGVDESSGIEPGILSVGFVNSTCTATIISRKGHLLTARHCIESAISFGTVQGPYDLYERTQPTADVYKTSYAAAVTGLLHIPFGLDDGVVYGSVVATGPGTLYPRFDTALDASDKEVHRKLTDAGYSAGGDFAILHVPALADRDCRKLGHAPPIVGAKSRAISFSCFRGDDPWPQEREATNSLVTTDVGVEVARTDGLSEWLARGNFSFPFVADDCNSGSPVFDEHDRVYGVVHTTGLRAVDSAPQTVAMSVSRIFELLNSETATLLRDLNRECL